MIEETRVCNHCGEEKPLSEMSKEKKNGKIYYRRRCHKCDSARKIKWQKENYDKYSESQAQVLKRRREQRSALEESHKYIYWDSRGSDKKKALDNDLTKEFIRDLIAEGCRYCGETNIRMTLDRIDNTIGHTQNNVIPCCIRCNIVKRDMPYEAWLMIAPAMREARKKGLFRGWTGRS
jgi:hypothetical protein